MTRASTFTHTTQIRGIGVRASGLWGMPMSTPTLGPGNGDEGEEWSGTRKGASFLHQGEKVSGSFHFL